jgi:CBS domain-containing protein
MDRMYGQDNSFSGKNLSQGGRKREAEVRENRGKQSGKHIGFSESDSPSKPRDERHETCLWMTIDELMTRDIVTVQENTPVEEIFSLYGKHHFYILPVVDDKNKLVGIIDLDIVLEILLLCLVPREKHTPVTAIRSLGSTAREIMISHPVIISLNATFKDASDLMMKYRLDHICVIADGKLVGILSKRDLVEEICRRRKMEKLREKTG